jgi:DNA-binding NarL/FixJ family response regulator
MIAPPAVSAARPTGMPERPTAHSPKGVVLADDHDVVRAGIQGLIELLPDVEVIAQARSGEELIALLDRMQPDLVVTDIGMPGVDGVEAVTRIRARHPSLPILVLSMFDSAEMVQRAVASGANGYLTKSAPPQELQHAIGVMLATGSYFNAAVARLLMHRVDALGEDGLTERQKEVLSLLASGLSSKEIAFQLNLSSKTIDVHRARIMERLELRDIASLTRYAVRRGLVKP